MEASNSELWKVGDWTARARLPVGEGPHPILLLLHGWTGDENVMWIFARNLSSRFFMLAPRGLHPEPQGGFSWHPIHGNAWSSVEDFRPAVEALSKLMDILRKGPPGGIWSGLSPDFTRLNLMGFSQGAALAYAFALLHPERVGSLAGLSGFLPEGSQSFIATRPLLGKPVFIAHGSRDETVPVRRARQAAEALEQAGGVVTYCEEDVGHKLTAPCFRALEAFYDRSVK